MKKNVQLCAVCPMCLSNGLYSDAMGLYAISFSR